MHLYRGQKQSVPQESSPGSVLKPADEALADLRARKTDFEISQLRTACAIAGSAFHHGSQQLRLGASAVEISPQFRQPLSTSLTQYQQLRRRWLCLDVRRYLLRARGGLGCHPSRIEVFCFGYSRTRCVEGAQPRPSIQALHWTWSEGFSAINGSAKPWLHRKSHDTLEAGMVFNVEPAIYFSGYGGIRHCDMELVRMTLLFRSNWKRFNGTFQTKESCARSARPSTSRDARCQTAHSRGGRCALFKEIFAEPNGPCVIISTRIQGNEHETRSRIKGLAAKASGQPGKKGSKSTHLYGRAILSSFDVK